MLHTLDFIAHWGMFGAFGFFRGGIGFVFMILFFMFVFGMRRGRGGYYHGGQRGYRHYRGYYNSPPQGTPGPYQGQSPDAQAPGGEAPRYGSQQPTQNAPTYQGHPYEPGEPTVRIDPQQGTGGTNGASGGADTIRVDRPAGDSGQP